MSVQEGFVKAVASIALGTATLLFAVVAIAWLSEGNDFFRHHHFAPPHGGFDCSGP